jgi:hypothetical protein
MLSLFKLIHENTRIGKIAFATVTLKESTSALPGISMMAETRSQTWRIRMPTLPFTLTSKACVRPHH